MYKTLISSHVALGSSSEEETGVQEVIGSSLPQQNKRRKKAKEKLLPKDKARIRLELGQKFNELLPHGDDFSPSASLRAKLHEIGGEFERPLGCGKTCDIFFPYIFGRFHPEKIPWLRLESAGLGISLNARQHRSSGRNKPYSLIEDFEVRQSIASFFSA